MNENYNSYNENAVQISIPNLILYMLKHWKTLIIAVIAGLLLGGILCAWRAPKAVSQDEQEEENISWAEDYEVDSDVAASMQIASRYRELYEKQLEYNTNSVIMNLNANSFYTGELKYFISAGNKTDLLCSLYENIINRDETLKSIRKEAGLTCGEQYIKELLGYGIDSEMLTMNNGTILSNANQIEMVNTDEENGIVIQYTVIAADKSSCEAMINTLQDIITVESEQYQESYGTYTFEKISDAIRSSSNTDYLSKQRSAVDALNSYLTNAQKLEKEFSGDEQKYYQTVYMNQIAEEKENVEVESADVSLSVKDILKYIIIGLFLTCACWGGWFFFKYLLDNHVKDSEELSRTWGIKVLGVAEGDKHSFWGKYMVLDRMFNRRSADSKMYILSMIEMLQKDHVLICGDQNNIEIQNCKQWILKEKQGTVTGDLLARDSKTLEMSKNNDGIIYIVKLGSTTYSEIIKELQVCNLQNLNMLGAIVID